MSSLTLLFAALGLLIYLALVPFRIILSIMIRLLRRRIKKVLARLQLQQDQLKELQEMGSRLIEIRDSGNETQETLSEIRTMQFTILKNITLTKLRILSLKVILWVFKINSKFLKYMSHILVSSTTIVGLVTAFVVSASLIVVTVLPGVLDYEFGVTTSTTTNTSIVNTTNYEIFNINWTQDFSELYTRVEEDYGKSTRDWVEFTILGLAVQQQALNETYEDGTLKYTIPGFINGFKGVETGSGISDLGSTPITSQEFFAYTYAGRLWGTTDTGVFQFDTIWEEYNPSYTTYKNSERQSKGGLATYLPDAMYGIVNRFSRYTVYPSTTDSREVRGAQARAKAFEVLGVTQTPEKDKVITALTSVANLYNAIFLDLGNYGFNSTQTDNAAYVNALLLIQYCELYGYGSTDLTFNLAQSIQRQSGNLNAFSLEKSYAVQAIYGAVGTTYGYPDSLDSVTNYGVITEKGVPVDGSLFFYLVSQMNTQAQNDVLTSEGIKAFLETDSYHYRPRYDITVLLIGVYDSVSVYNLAKQMGY